MSNFKCCSSRAYTKAMYILCFTKLRQIFCYQKWTALLLFCYFLSCKQWLKLCSMIRKLRNPLLAVLSFNFFFYNYGCAGSPHYSRTILKRKQKSTPSPKINKNEKRKKILFHLFCLVHIVRDYHFWKPSWTRKK